MSLFTHILKETWGITVEMAPYLLFGFLMAGVLSVVISKSYVERHLGGRGWIASIKAALIGVPMPICSCGVIPLAASLRKHGASRGATASFLASTPQTGVDSLMITYALLGWVFALIRAIVALFSGIFCGIAVEAVSKPEELSKENRDKSCTAACCDTPHKSPLFLQMLRYGFLDLPRSVSKSMLIGILLSGIISALIPENYFADRMGDSIGTMFLMLAIGIPLYVCSSGSVPIALAFIKAGISPGAALIFLITGPATNAATLTTLWQILGKKQLIAFLGTLIFCALSAGFLTNALDLEIGSLGQAEKMATHIRPLDLFYSILLLLVLVKGILPRKKQSSTSN